jgi:CubicO group peptidase (beta-lactamase class C family)
VRLLQLWARLFIASMILYAAALIAAAAGAPASFPVAVMAVVPWVSAAGGVVVVMIMVRLAMLKRRLLRVPAARPGSAADSPHDIIERAFAPLVQSKAVRDLAVAVILPGQRVTYFPSADVVRHQTSLYEIGSLTKPMTAEVLASMILDGTATMATRIGDVLPQSSLPAPIAEITLEELVTHQSGLPRIPRTFRMALAAAFSSDPYRWFGGESLLRSLASAHRTTPRGTYSNFGFAVLGRLLGEMNGSDFRSALQARLLGPLGLSNTCIGPDGVTTLRQVRGHDRTGVPTPRWHAGAFAAAGGVSMTIADGAKWLGAHVEPPDGFRDMAAMVTRPLAPFGVDQIGMGWIIKQLDGMTVAWHNGGTGGFSSFAAFAPARGVGIIAFAASAHVPALDRAGFHVVRECVARWGASDGEHRLQPG